MKLFHRQHIDDEGDDDRHHHQQDAGKSQNLQSEAPEALVQQKVPLVRTRQDVGIAPCKDIGSDPILVRPLVEADENGGDLAVLRHGTFGGIRSSRPARRVARQQDLFAGAPLCDRHRVVDGNEHQSIAAGVDHAARQTDDQVVILTQAHPVLQREPDTFVGDRLEVPGSQIPSSLQLNPLSSILWKIEAGDGGAQITSFEAELLTDLNKAPDHRYAGDTLDAPVHVC